GVSDGFEHDGRTTVQQRFYAVARFMARPRHIAGVLGLYASAAGMARVPRELVPRIEEAAREAARRHRAMGAGEEREAMAALQARGMTIRDLDRSVFLPRAGALWQDQARALAAGPWPAAAPG